MAETIARIEFVKSYFSRTCYCRIPAHFILHTTEGRQFDGSSREDVIATARRYGVSVARAA